MDTVATPRSSCQSLVDSLLPANSVHLLAGAPGAGKTTLAAWLLRKLKDGEPIFEHTSHRPAAMGVIVADRPWASHAPWFAAVGLEDIPYYSFQDDSTFRWDHLERSNQWMQALLHAIERHRGWLPPGAVLLIDPISPFLGGDLLNYTRVFSAISTLAQFCTRRQLTVIGTAHSAKQRAGKEFQYVRPQDRILGSTALVGCADTVMYLATPSELGEHYWELTWAPHHAKQDSRRLVRDRRGLFRLAPHARSHAERIAARRQAARQAEEARKEAVRQAKEARKQTAMAARKLAGEARYEEHKAEILLRNEELLGMLFSPVGEEPPTGLSTARLIERGRCLGLSRRSLFRRIGQLARTGLIVQVSRGYWKRNRPS